MTYALVMIEVPADLALMPVALSNIRHLKELPLGATQLPGYSWLIDLSVGLPFFATMLRHIESASPGLPHRIAFLEERPHFAACTS